MTIEEIETVVARCAQLRSPTFGADDRLPGKISRLENHMLACAHARGDLEACWRHVARTAAKLQECVDEMPGRSGPERERALRAFDDATWGALRDARQLRVEVERQIVRLIHDEKTVSRAYTFITGQQ